MPVPRNRAGVEEHAALRRRDGEWETHASGPRPRDVLCDRVDIDAELTRDDIECDAVSDIARRMRETAFQTEVWGYRYRLPTRST
jgi:hypothetical protein